MATTLKVQRFGRSINPSNFFKESKRITDNLNNKEAWQPLQMCNYVYMARILRAPLGSSFLKDFEEF